MATTRRADERFFCAAILCCASTLAACGGGGGQANPPQAPLSFNVDATLSWTGQDFGIPGPWPGSLPFTLTLAPGTAGQQQLIAGGNGDAAVVPVTFAGGKISYRNTDPALLDQRQTTLRLGLPTTDRPSCNGVTDVSFSQMDLQISGDKATGQAQGFVGFQDGDALGTRAFTAAITGAADRTAPAPDRPQAAEVAVHPFDGVTIDFPEALPMTSTARLVDGTTSYPLTAMPVDYPSRFIAGATLLPFGRRLRLETDSLHDLAGNVATASALTVVTPDLPGPFVGFEGAAAAVIGQARIVDDTVIPALAGKHALLLAGGRFTARLTVPAGATTLVIGARALVAADGGGPWLRTRLGVVGGTIAEVPTEITWATGATPSGLAAFPQMFPPTQFRNALPAGATEVVVDLRSDVPGCGAFLPPGASLIDSLTVE